MNAFDTSRRRLGVHVDEEGKTVARLWAPLAGKAWFHTAGKSWAMEPEKYGYWRLSAPFLQPGDLYFFSVDEGPRLPDPASLSQPEGVHGPSAVTSLAYAWKDGSWVNPSLSSYIIYELHTGSFTEEGDLAGIAGKLDYLVELGITAIEIMPLAQFPGSRNWGYDGVFPFAVQDSYGGAAGLQRLVDACHARGLAVILDVVYNHMGPEGNYLGQYGPYFTNKYKTPWGDALNFDDAWCDGVRRFFIENAIMWLRDFHVDALRLDAVHAIRDFSAQHFLRELREAVRALEAQTGRQYYLIAESDLNDPRMILPAEAEGYGMDAQWVDEFHHALRVTAGGERSGYYADFSGIGHLCKAYCDAYVYNGQYSTHRQRRFGRPATGAGGEQFVVFSQNHDQVGNRALGERTSVLHSFEMTKLLAGAVLLSPYIPLLFMGEEWGETNPFFYFVSHTDPGLAAAVRQGRKAEFAAFFEGGEGSEAIPDPMEEETFRRSKLNWKLLESPRHQTLLRYYRELIRLRKTHPALSRPDRKLLHVECHPEWQTAVLHRWNGEDHVVCFMNFSKRQQYVMPPSYASRWFRLLHSAAPQWLGASVAPATIAGGNPGSSTLVLEPESLLVYSNTSF